MLPYRLLVALACFPLVACMEELNPPVDPGSGSGSGSASPPDDPLFDAAMLASTQGYRHFSKVNAKAYVSAIGAFDINVFAHGSNLYGKIHPEVTDTHIVMPVGTTIVREVLDANQQVAKLTMMIKGPAGYDPTLGDWWFAVADPEGNVLPDASGEPQIGRLTACHGCHLPRAGDDFLFGVPAADEHN